MKNFEEFLKPDTRISLLGCGPNEGEKAVKILYERALSCSLADNVPKKVKELWEVAQHLYVYSSYSYDFIPVSKTYCYFCLELALKEMIFKITGKSVKTFGEVLKNLKYVFPDIEPLQEQWFKNQKNSRNLKAHPAGRELTMFGDTPLRIYSMFLNGLFHDEGPLLVIPSGWLYNPNELFEPFKKYLFELFPSYFEKYVHISKSIEFVEYCRSRKVSIVGMYGLKRVPTGTYFVQGVEAEFSDINAESWDEYLNKNTHRVTEAINSWLDKGDFYLNFSLIHKGEWLTCKMQNRTVIEAYF